MGLHGSTCMWTEEQFSEHLLRQISSRESKLRTWRNLAVVTFSHCLVEEWDEVTGPASLQPLAGQGLNQGSRVPTRAVLLASPHHTVGERSKAWRDCSLQSHKLPSQLTHSKWERQTDVSYWRSEMCCNGRTRADRGLQRLYWKGSGFCCFVWVGREKQQRTQTQICCDSAGFSTMVTRSDSSPPSKILLHMARIMMNCVILIVLVTLYNADHSLFVTRTVILYS